MQLRDCPLVTLGVVSVVGFQLFTRCCQVSFLCLVSSGFGCHCLSSILFGVGFWVVCHGRVGGSACSHQSLGQVLRVLPVSLLAVICSHLVCLSVPLVLTWCFWCSIVCSRLVLLSFGCLLGAVRSRLFAWGCRVSFLGVVRSWLLVVCYLFCLLLALGLHLMVRWGG